MKKIFKPKDFFKVPDNTYVSPFLNSKDSMSDLTFNLIDGYSMAMGKIEKNSRSQIHVHLHLAQVTFVLSGNINLMMKGTSDAAPYELQLEKHEAALTGKTEFFQLINPYEEDCEVLYIASPEYLFEMVDNKIIYDDAIMLKKSWEELRIINWLPDELNDVKNSLESRNMSFQRIKQLKHS